MMMADENHKSSYLLNDYTISLDQLINKLQYNNIQLLKNMFIYTLGA